MRYNISPEGIDFIADYESFYEKPYHGLDSQNQFDSLVSFSYNFGVTALNNSTLLKDIKFCTSYEKIKEDFLMWYNCNGTRARGLYRRRFDEFEMYANTYYTRTYSDF